MGSAEGHGKLWGAAAKDWAELSEPDDRPLWEAMLASAGVGRETRFLDLGCGAGGASVLAAARGARVAGLDVSEALLRIARERTPAGAFMVGDVGRLPYGDGAFDVTFASLCLMFATDPAGALAEMERVTARGGRVTVGVWGRPEVCEYRHVLEAVGGLLAPAPSARGPFALSGPGILEGLMAGAGLAVMDSREVEAPFIYADVEMMWRTVRAAGPVQAAIRRAGEGRVKAAVVQAAEPFQTEKGEIVLNNQFRYVTAGVGAGRGLERLPPSSV